MKYLLLTTCAGHQDDDDLMSNSGAISLGVYTTLEECMIVAQDDLSKEAKDMAINVCGDDADEEELDEYARDYIADTEINTPTEEHFGQVSDTFNIITSEYHSGECCDSRVYTIVRIA